MTDLEDFELWLRTNARGRGRKPLAATSVATYVGEARVIMERGSAAPRRMSLLGAAKKMIEWPGCSAAYREICTALLNAGLEQDDRVHEARSLPDKTWAAFGRLVEAERTASPAVAVLSVLIDTGLRVGDVLRLPTKNLRAGQTSGVVELVLKGRKAKPVRWDGAPEAWAALAEHAQKHPKAKLVAEVVVASSSPAPGGAAYRAVYRAMRALGTRVDPDERWHPHRIRRTVGVNALRETKDVAAVQQLLAHENLNTTAGYLDEVRDEETAALQRTLANKRRTR